MFSGEGTVYVFCEAFDLPALWAAGRLRSRGVRTEIFSAQLLEAALSWNHSITSDGDAHVELVLADGRTISSAREPAGVLNRLLQVPRSRIDQVGGEDKEYATQEMSALFLSWLSAWPGPMINKPRPEGLCGRW